MNKNTIRINNGERIRSLVALLSFVVIFGVSGVLLKNLSHADSTTVANITSGNSGYCLNNYEDSSTAGTIIDIYACNTTAEQKWSIDNTTETIKNNNLCVGLKGNSSAQNTDVILATCTGSTTQQWLQESNGNLVNIGANKQCLYAPNEETTTQLTIVACATSVPKSEIWKGGPVPPTVPPTISTVGMNSIGTAGAAITWTTNETSTGQVKYGTTTAYGKASSENTSLTTSHSITLTGLSSGTTYHFAIISINTENQSATSSDYTFKTATPAPTPKPTPVQTVTSTNTPAPVGSLAVTSNGSDTGSGSTSTGSGSATGSGSTSTGSGSETVSASTQSSGSSSSSLVPTIKNLTASDIKAHSVVLTWQVSKPASYIIEYGSSPTALNEKITYTSKKTSISITLSNLKSSEQTYLSVTPKVGTKTGATKLVSFSTTTSNLMGPILAIVLSLAMIGLIALFIVRSKSKSSMAYAPAAGSVSTTSSVNLDPKMPIFNKEDQNTYNARVNWWLPKYIQQQGPAALHHKKADDIPDMFERGRARLHDLEDHNRIPRA